MMTASADANKDIVRRFYEAIDAADREAIDDLVAEDYLNHHPPPFPVSSGRAGVKDMFDVLLAATPGRHEIEAQIAEGDLVVTRLRAVGKHEGDFALFPATGNDLDVEAIAIHRVRDGKLVEHWGVVDSAALLAQLGAIELPAPPA
jgi:predicted ester cyclase